MNFVKTRSFGVVLSAMVTLLGCGQQVCIGPLGDCSAVNRNRTGGAAGGTGSVLAVQGAPTGRVPVVLGQSVTLAITGGTGPYSFEKGTCQGSQLVSGNGTFLGDLTVAGAYTASGINFVVGAKPGSDICVCTIWVRDRANNSPLLVTINVTVP